MKTTHSSISSSRSSRNIRNIFPSYASFFMMMIMSWSVPFRKGNVAVTAFSIANNLSARTTTTAAATAAAATGGSAAGICSRSFFGGQHSSYATPLFGRHCLHQQQNRAFSSGITSMHQSAVADTHVEAENDLTAKLGITHPAYDVVTKDVVSEYGAYCTLYKHKKSGAQILSVSNDDDNKVRLLNKNVSAIRYYLQQTLWSLSHMLLILVFIQLLKSISTGVWGYLSNTTLGQHRSSPHSRTLRSLRQPQVQDQGSLCSATAGVPANVFERLYVSRSNLLRSGQSERKGFLQPH